MVHAMVADDRCSTSMRSQTFYFSAVIPGTQTVPCDQIPGLQFLGFMLYHLWSYDKFRCLHWSSGRQPGAFKRVMTVRSTYRFRTIRDILNTLRNRTIVFLSEFGTSSRGIQCGDYGDKISRR